ncbi:MAG: ShlB/FhaC/HecB family hemolysin secretion/activation protein [Pseudomonadota bacterium]
MEGPIRLRTALLSGLTFALLGVWSALVVAQNPVPPSAVTPGGVQPRLDERDRAARDRGLGDADPGIDIPAMLDRPLPMTGEKLSVRGFELLLPEDEDFQPLAPDLNAYLAKSLAEQPADGYFLAEIESIVGEVTTRLRDAGLVVSRAYIPAQTVNDGVVQVRVLPGRLGEVRVEGNRRYSARTINRPFDSLEGEPIRLSELESGLLRLTAYPGLAPFGVLSPGERLGETDLTIRVDAEDAIDFSISSNNHGNEFTGRYQGIAELSWYNPTGAADSLRLRVLQSVSPANSIYGSADYVRPLPFPAFTIGAGFFTNAYEIGRDLAELGLEGDSIVGNIFLDYQFLRQRTKSGYLRLDIARKNTQIREAGTATATDNLTVATAEFGIELVDRFRGANQLAIAYHRGFNDLFGALDATGDNGASSRISNFNEFAPGEFQKVTVRASRVQQITKKNHSLLLRGFYQHSDDLLVSLEQVSLGGPYNVRAYPVAQQLVDKGGFVTAEWVMRAPGFASRNAWGGRTWGDIFSLSFFFDYGFGRIVDPIISPAQGLVGSVNLSGVGVGFDFRFTERSQFRVDVATPLSDTPVDDDPQVYANFFFGLK